MNTLSRTQASLGKGEVESSILSRSTISSLQFRPIWAPHASLSHRAQTAGPCSGWKLAQTARLASSPQALLTAPAATCRQADRRPRPTPQYRAIAEMLALRSALSATIRAFIASVESRRNIFPMHSAPARWSDRDAHFDQPIGRQGPRALQLLLCVHRANEVEPNVTATRRDGALSAAIVRQRDGRHGHAPPGSALGAACRESRAQSR
jgi:hypothetical protein